MSALSLAPRALYEEVAELLRQRIFARELEPGSWIDELRIAEALGISRTPLREALKVLAAEGLVTMKVRRGAYVTEVNEKDLRDVYHLLALLESDAARVVAERASDAQLAELQAQQLALEAAVNDRDRFFEINEAFAVIAIAALRELGLAHAQVNVHGGACALGHPIGCTGARIVVTLLHEMQRRNAKKGIASLCIGGGMGVALTIER